MTQAQREKELELLMIGRQFRSAIASYYQASVPLSAADTFDAAQADKQFSGSQDLRRYPISLNELLIDPRYPVIHRHLRKIFIDPMTGSSDWGLIIIGGRIVGVHSLSEKIPMKQGGFEPEDGRLANASTFRDWTFVYPSDFDVAASFAGGRAPARNTQ